MILLYTFLGTLIWNTVLTVLGSVLGENWTKLVDIINTYSKVVLVIIVILFIIGVIVFYKTRAKKKKNKK